MNYVRRERNTTRNVLHFPESTLLYQEEEHLENAAAVQISLNQPETA
jgi:hypothetical protein